MENRSITENSAALISAIVPAASGGDLLLTGAALICATNVILALYVFCSMYPGHHGGGNRGPQQQQFGTATLKTPPQWSPEIASQYPYASFVNDVLLWSLATDMDRLRQGPAVAMQLGGTARLVVRQMTERPAGYAEIQQGRC